MRPKLWKRTLAGILAFTLVFGNVPLAGAEPLIDRIAITASADTDSPDPTAPVTLTLEPVSATYNGEPIALVTVPEAFLGVKIGYSLGVPGDHREETANKLTQLASMYSEQKYQHKQAESPDQNAISLFRSLEWAATFLYDITAGAYNESSMEDATSFIAQAHTCLDQMDAAQQKTYARYLDKLYAALPGGEASLASLETFKASLIVELQSEIPKATNAGKYTVYYAPIDEDAGNYTVPDAENGYGTLVSTITPASLTLEPVEATYNGAQTALVTVPEAFQDIEIGYSLEAPEDLRAKTAEKLTQLANTYRKKMYALSAGAAPDQNAIELFNSLENAASYLSRIAGDVDNATEDDMRDAKSDLARAYGFLGMLDEATYKPYLDDLYDALPGGKESLANLDTFLTSLDKTVELLTEIPQATNAGSYTVYYVPIGADAGNYTFSDPALGYGTVRSTITPAELTLEPVTATYTGKQIDLVTVPEAFKGVEISYSMQAPEDLREETAKELDHLMLIYDAHMEQLYEAGSLDQNESLLFASLETAADFLHRITAGRSPEDNESYMENATSYIAQAHKCLKEIDAEQQETFESYLNDLYAALPGGKESLTNLATFKASLFRMSDPLSEIPKATDARKYTVYYAPIGADARNYTVLDPSLGYDTLVSTITPATLTLEPVEADYTGAQIDLVTVPDELQGVKIDYSMQPPEDLRADTAAKIKKLNDDCFAQLVALNASGDNGSNVYYYLYHLQNTSYSLHLIASDREPENNGALLEEAQEDLAEAERYFARLDATDQETYKSYLDKLYAALPGGKESLTDLAAFKASLFRMCDPQSTIPTGTDAGAYTVYYRSLDPNYADDIHTLTSTITAIPAEIIPPQAKELIYNGEAQDLVTPGKAVKGTMEYRLGKDGEWSEKIPTATEAGDYKVYYRAVGEAPNYEDADADAPVTVTIQKGKLTPTISVADWTYGETPHEPQITGIPEGIKYEVKITDAGGASAEPKDAGIYHVVLIVPESDNYEAASVDEEFTIQKGKLTPTISMADWTYGEKASVPEITIPGVPEGYDYTVTYTKDGETVATPEHAGSYIATLTVPESDNYNKATAEARFEIRKASIETTAPTANTLTYNGKAQTLVAPGTATFGEMEYSLDGLTFSTDLPAATDAGTYSVYYRVPGDEDHDDVQAERIEVTIAQAPLALAPVEATYNGEPIDLVTVPEAFRDIKIGYSLEAPGDHSAETAEKLDQLRNTYIEPLNQLGQAESRDLNAISFFGSLTNAAYSLYLITAGVSPAENEFCMNRATSNIALAHQCLDQMDAAQQKTYAPYLEELFAALPGGEASLADLETFTASLNVKFLPKIPQATNAGEYTVYYAPISGNYTIPDAPNGYGTLVSTITPAELDLALESVTATYTGKPIDLVTVPDALPGVEIGYSLEAPVDHRAETAEKLDQLAEMYSKQRNQLDKGPTREPRS